MDDNKGLIAGFLAMYGVMALFVIALNLAFWGGLIYFGFWCAQHFGLI